jgi:hypothetical protein
MRIISPVSGSEESRMIPQVKEGHVSKCLILVRSASLSQRNTREITGWISFHNPANSTSRLQAESVVFRCSERIVSFCGIEVQSFVLNHGPCEAHAASPNCRR